MARIAWAFAPSPHRWWVATLYPAPVLVFLAVALLHPAGAAWQSPLPMTVGLAFAAIPTVVLFAFHAWVLAPAPAQPQASPLRATDLFPRAR